MDGDSVRFSILDFNAYHLSNLGLGIMILYCYFLSLARFQLLILPQTGKKELILKNDVLQSVLYAWPGVGE